MIVSELKQILKNQSLLTFQLPNGNFVPSHFHITEVGKITKQFIDCGGTLRNETTINFQLWEANDFSHQLLPEKLLQIIELSEENLNLEDVEIEVEYQMPTTIGKFNLEFDGTNFQLISKTTACLALDNCGIPKEKTKVKIGEWKLKEGTCKPNSNCC